MARYHRLHVLVASCSLALASTLACLWPTTTEADDAEAAVARQQDIGSNKTLVGKVEVSSRLVKDDKAKWYVEIEATNKDSEGREAVDVEEQIIKTTFRPMSRVGGAFPQVAWTVKEKVDLMPGEKRVVRHEIPRWLGWQVAQSVKAAESGQMTAIATNFSTNVNDARQPKADAQTAALSRAQGEAVSSPYQALRKSASKASLALQAGY